MGTPGSLIDASGYITCPKVRAAYDRICDSPGLRLHFERVQSAEAFLQLLLRSEIARRLFYRSAP